MGFFDKKTCPVCGEAFPSKLISIATFGLDRLLMSDKCSDCNSLCHRHCLRDMMDAEEFENDKVDNLKLCSKCFDNRYENLPKDIQCTECENNLFLEKGAKCVICELIAHEKCLCINANRIDDIIQILNPYVIKLFDIESEIAGLDISSRPYYTISINGLKYLCSSCFIMLVNEADQIIERRLPEIIPINKPCKFRESDIIRKISVDGCDSSEMARERMIDLALQLDGNAIVHYCEQTTHVTDDISASGLVLKTDLSELTNDNFDDKYCEKQSRIRAVAWSGHQKLKDALLDIAEDMWKNGDTRLHNEIAEYLYDNLPIEIKKKYNQISQNVIKNVLTEKSKEYNRCRGIHTKIKPKKDVKPVFPSWDEWL